MKFVSPLVLFYLYCPIPTCFSQSNQPVRWHFESDCNTKNELSITMQASIAPGWHLYSQYMRDGGPIPTHFQFNQNDSFILLGKPDEKGIPKKYYDDLYEMDITWYSGEVSFIQKIRIVQPITTVTGTVEYLTCNELACVPGKQSFSILVQVLEKIK